MSATHKNQSAQQIVAQDENNNIILSYGTTVPSDGDDGYVTGAIFLQTDGGVGTAAYLNEGSTTTADFNAIQPGAAGGSFTSDITLTDGTDIELGTGGDADIRWSEADASDPSLVVGLGDTSQMLHITDKGAIATDWAITSPTHPTLYIHSNTTPTTDYISIGGHDATTATIAVASGALNVTATTSITLTPTTDTLLANGTGLVVGHTAQLTISDGDGATNLIPELQVVGTAKADSSLLLAAFNTTDNATVAPSLNFLKSGNAAVGSNTIVAANEILGEITWFGDDGVDYEAPAAQIQGIALATPGAGDMPGAVLVRCTTDAGETLAEVGRFSVAAGLTLGVAGTSLGKLSMSGNTSGTITINTAAAAGTWTLTLPPDDGDAGEQLQTNGSGVTTWEAAASLRQVKQIVGALDDAAHAALERICSRSVYAFHYKPKDQLPEKLPSCSDTKTEFRGVMADEYPEVMMWNGRIFSPISAFGEAMLAIKALAAEVSSLKAQLAAGA